MSNTTVCPNCNGFDDYCADVAVCEVCHGSGKVPVKTRVVNRRREHFDIYIGRPGPWGNPFSHKPSTLAKFRVATREEAIAAYRKWFLAQPELVARGRRELRGKILGCWCKPASCHGDVIAEIVDSEDDARSAAAV